jgi:hypothetical protein
MKEVHEVFEFHRLWYKWNAHLGTNIEFPSIFQPLLMISLGREHRIWVHIMEQKKITNERKVMLIFMIP